ncbi:6-bladed beta-propeller [Maribellus maritimus]|uniref:6-bladed beta-propeller n=1 Tax=Maribellus maritimus TaxID=2870838 RepID=UPI001EEB8600|nr:6-bladed beta-propeller [Maribellus maritimus]MCG6188045.1 6-bladed beta-propeller [Maribellus maritimus]
MKINLKGIFLFAVVVSLFVGCTENEQSNIVTLEPTESEKLESGKPTQIIKLETSAESNLGVVTKVLTDFDAHRIFVLSDDNVSIFDSEGKFITKLKKGRGPGELTMVVSISLAIEEELFYVLDNNNRVYIFDYDGNLIDRQNLKNIAGVIDI